MEENLLEFGQTFLGASEYTMLVVLPSLSAEESFLAKIIASVVS